ncbi:MAG: hypothetical protein EZS28_014525 [Streblomastix strix]|uniref:Uncharacterized protein n=1 Tax=Streblomastix strix TaxID=222440 RepID=A0A5J4W4V3_9EUKA|nr:MAG: hypothetical protein EZS28_014525 [Streblomastix strix]
MLNKSDCRLNDDNKRFRDNIKVQSWRHQKENSQAVKSGRDVRILALIINRKRHRNCYLERITQQESIISEDDEY